MGMLLCRKHVCKVASDSLEPVLHADRDGRRQDHERPVRPHARPAPTQRRGPPWRASGAEMLQPAPENLLQWRPVLTEWVVLLAGSASLLIEGEEAPRILRPGDYVEIPPHARHWVEWTDADRPTVWLAVHLGR